MLLLYLLIDKYINQLHVYINQKHINQKRWYQKIYLPFNKFFIYICTGIVLSRL